MDDARSILIFGASRGIGLGLAAEFAKRGWRVFATERSSGSGLSSLKGVEILTADITDPASYSDLPFEAGSLDAVLINAGIFGAADQSLQAISSDDVAEVMMTNAFGPARAARALLPAIRDGGTLAFMSSLMVSIADSSGGFALYRTSKAAQNMLAKGIAEQNAGPRDIAVLSLHPGWVQTAMGGANAPVTVDESVAGLADLLVSSGGAGHRFLDYTGKPLPF